IEAMTFGLPVVGTDAGGIKEIVKDGINGFIVPKQNPQKLAEAILKIYSDKYIYEKFSENSTKLVKDFSSSNMAKQTIDVYEKIIKNN
ncbi:MAG: glycosyltransferase family 4 protein, partial [Elusimicrobiales bacterium]|nr:glycosyltransferase family 4 protein [Elusimicrobiales bacterium]